MGLRKDAELATVWLEEAEQQVLLLQGRNYFGKPIKGTELFWIAYQRDGIILDCHVPNRLGG